MSPIPLLSSYLANQKSRSFRSGMGDVGGMFFFFTILCVRACQSRDKKKSVRTKQYAFTRGRDVFTRGLYFFTRGLYFFTRGLYFFTRSEVLGSGTIGIRLSQRSMHQTLFYCIGLYGLFRTVRVRPYPSDAKTVRVSPVTKSYKFFKKTNTYAVFLHTYALFLQPETDY